MMGAVESSPMKVGKCTIWFEFNECLLVQSIHEWMQRLQWEYQHTNVRRRKKVEIDRVHAVFGIDEMCEMFPDMLSGHFIV